MICQDEYQTYRHKGTEFLSRSFRTVFLHAFVPPLLELSILADALSLPAKGGIKPARPYPLFRPTTPSFPRSGRVKGKVGRNRGRSNGRSSPQNGSVRFLRIRCRPSPAFHSIQRSSNTTNFFPSIRIRPSAASSDSARAREGRATPNIYATSC